MLVTETVDSEKFLNILDLSKRQSAEIVMIPQVLGYHELGDWHVGGITSHTYITTTKLECFESIENMITVWNNPDLKYICFWYKELNFFLRLIRENELDRVTIYMNQYDVNGRKICICQKVCADVMVLWHDTRKGENHMINPTLPCISYIPIYERMKDMLFKWDHSGKLVLNKIVHTDEKFKRIWGLKASDGAKVWVPDEEDELKRAELLPYVMYLTKTIFSFGKQDKVELQIRDNIPMESPHVFMYMFNVMRRLKGINTNNRYYMCGLKVHN